MINKTFFAEPVMSTNGKLLGVELLTKFIMQICQYWIASTTYWQCR